eukprot:2048021-Amphidinium_carterae.1
MANRAECRFWQTKATLRSVSSYDHIQLDGKSHSAQQHATNQPDNNQPTTQHTGSIQTNVQYNSDDTPNQVDANLGEGATDCSTCTYEL